MEAKYDRAKQYATDNFDKCFGKSIDEIVKMMEVAPHDLPLDVIKIIERLSNAIGNSFIVVGSTALKNQGLLSRELHDIDILVTDFSIIEKISKTFNEIVPDRHQGSRQFLLNKNKVDVIKFELPNGMVLDVFKVDNVRPFDEILLKYSDALVRFEKVRSVIEAKNSYIQTADLNSEDIAKHSKDLHFISLLLNTD